MNKVGRPPIYKTPAAMEKKFAEYFSTCDKKGNVPNIMGMVLFMGFAERSSFLNYERKSDEFYNIVKRAKAMCLEDSFQRAAKGEMNPTIFIFNAVNNHKYINTRTAEAGNKEKSKPRESFFSKYVKK